MRNKRKDGQHWDVLLVGKGLQSLNSLLFGKPGAPHAALSLPEMLKHS